MVDISKVNSALIKDNIALQKRVEQLQAALASSKHNTQKDSVNQLSTMIRVLGDKIE